MSKATRTITASIIAALGLSSLSPLQQGAVIAVASTAALWASPALAQNTIPGVGTVVKKKPGDAAFITPSDANGETRITGLEPGTYSVRVFEGEQAVPMKVGRDGRLAFVTHEDADAPAARANDPRVRRAKPVVRRWAEQIPFEGGKSSGAVLDAGAGNSAGDPTCSADKPCASGIVSLAGIEVRRLVEATGISPEAARSIVSERAKHGPFKGLIDFAQRVCPQTDVDFQDASIRFGDEALMVRRGTNPKSPGFKCARASGEVEVFGKKHNYVGHVTLLR